ncbi:MAG: FHA domain-containing protein [Chloroflexota bacterium]
MSGPLLRLERLLEAVAERPVARLLPVGTPAEEVARRLERAAVDAARRRGAGGRAPSRWEVRVPTASRLAADPDRAGAALADALRARVPRHGVRFAAVPVVTVIGDPSLPRSGLRIGASAEPATGTGAADVDPWIGREGPGRPAEQPGALRAVLAVTVPGMPQAWIGVGDAVLLVGRGRDCAVRLPDAGVSRRHGRLAWQQGVLVYTDLGSRNGSLLNGRPVRAAALGAGDRLVLGRSVIDVEPADAA